ncbi:hypothetical protein ACFLTL_00370 [Chloroflexota bacterium]
MDDIKSAREIAREKVEELGVATEEERLQWKYVPEGEALAGRYLRQESNLVTELGKYEEKAARYVAKGATGILVRNIDLPRSDDERKTNRQVMEGLKVLKQDKAGVENVYSKIRRIFDHYAGQGEEQREQGYQALKADFENKMKQAMQQQLGTLGGMKIDVERQPQFQEEWRRMQLQMDASYNTYLNEFRRELLAID